MNWVYVCERLPNSIGLYAISQLLSGRVDDFNFAWFDGIGFVLPQEVIKGQVAPYRNPRFWSVIKLGQGYERRIEKVFKGS